MFRFCVLIVNSYVNHMKQWNIIQFECVYSVLQHGFIALTLVYWRCWLPVCIGIYTIQALICRKLNQAQILLFQWLLLYHSYVFLYVTRYCLVSQRQTGLVTCKRFPKNHPASAIGAPATPVQYSFQYAHSNKIVVFSLGNRFDKSQ